MTAFDSRAWTGRDWYGSLQLDLLPVLRFHIGYNPFFDCRSVALCLLMRWRPAEGAERWFFRFSRFWPRDGVREQWR